MRFILYGFIFAGICLMCKDSLYYLKLKILGRARYFRQKKNILNQGRINPLDEWLYVNLEAAGLGDKITPLVLKAVSLIFATALCLGATLVSSIWQGLASFVLGISVPLIMLHIRLSSRRHKASLEGEKLLREISSAYKLRDKNIGSAIEYSSKHIDEAPISKGILINLSERINSSFVEEDYVRAIESLSYGINTSWSKALGKAIFLGLTMGIDISESLNQLTTYMASLNQRREFTKRANSESKLTLIYMVPICYLLTILCATRYFNFTILKFLKYQFVVPMGLKWFTITLAIYILGLYVYYYLSAEKMDI